MSNFPPNSYPGAAPMGAPPRKSNKTLFIILGVVGLVMLLCCGGVGIFGWVGFNAVQGLFNDQAKQIASMSPEVKAELGEVQSVTLNLQKTGQASGGGNQVFVFDVQGSTGSGEIWANVPQGGQSLTNPILKTSDGREIPLSLPDLNADYEVPGATDESEEMQPSGAAQ